ncbi:putative high affinity immunoglobulin gamma Fc receptor IB [Hemibagrus wyckioides]|uniref:putative high affinity immunoglobulin gamma Fc receptor IB n=1 Tax=Hemibagrus wyckioides TaxID=337641 RepID=UPI00266C32A4|nr:putative high affinity immunoglobulin gamma Fc receptor IB [Hemibagrus wyckioides]
MELWSLCVIILFISLIQVGKAQDNKPVLTVQPNLLQIFRGETVTLSCRISGGSGTYDWYKDNGFDHRSSAKDYTIKVDQSHRYSCYGFKDGQATARSNEVTLSVIERPKAVVTLQPDGEIFSGEKVTFTCEIRGHEDTVDGKWMYSWYKDGVRLSDPVENREYSFTAVESFSGKYTCSGQRKSDSQTSETSTAVTLTVSGPGSNTVPVAVAVGLSLALLFIILLLILLWKHKYNKGKDRGIQQNSNQTPGQSQSGAEDSQSGYTLLQTGNEHIYATMGSADHDAGPSDVTYVELELKPQKKVKKKQVKANAEPDTVYSELKQNT